jgi:hypothetical protein
LFCAKLPPPATHDPPEEHGPGNSEPQLGENPLYRPSSSISHTRARRVLVLERKIETTDYTDYTDYERVMNFMTPIIWVSLRLDRSGSSHPCNPLQSVKSVVKNATASFFIFIF